MSHLCLSESDLKLLRHRGCHCGAIDGCNVFVEQVVKDLVSVSAVHGYKLAKSQFVCTWLAYPRWSADLGRAAESKKQRGLQG